MKPSKRLIEQFRPKSYALSIEPDIEKLAFKGYVLITGVLNQASDKIILHTKDLKLTKIMVDDKVAQPIYDTEEGEVTLNFKSKISANTEIRLKINFDGKIGQSNTGLYLSTYKEDGIQKKMLATQLEPANARQVLPCIDEPSAKATFKLSVIAPKEMNVISNTLVEKIKTEGKNNVTIFKVTPKMSTYLLAIIIGFMEYEELKTKNGVIIRSYGIKEDVKHAMFGLETAKKVIEWYDDFFGTPYPLKNLNMIGMPDFEAGVGAMENWGCIVYRADSLFVNPKMTSLTMKQYCGIVVAHEIAHQWFGNLVTMEWWDDLWLNEGFATWAEFMVASEIFPEWNLWSDFLANDYVRAMQLDSRSQSHPIVAKIDNVNQIAGAFDAITYRKGASVIRMLADYLGHNNFRKGVRKYIKDYQYSNATTENLWESLSIVSGKDVKTFMHSWTNIEGHPIITIGKNKITQERFVYNPKSKIKSKEPWLVPLQSEAGFEITLTENVHILDQEIDTNTIFNVGQTGFYRIQYSRKMLGYFIKNYSGINEIDKIGFFFDAFDQAEAAYLNIADVMPLLQLLKDEKSSHVWDSALAGLGSVHNLFINDDNEQGFLKYNVDWLKPQIDRLGFCEKLDESPNDTLIRPQAISLALRYRHPETIKKLLAMYVEILDDPNLVNADLRGIVYVAAAKSGGKETFEELLSLYRDTDHSEEQRRIASGLCAFENPDLGKKVRDLILDGTVKVQDAYVWIIHLYINKHQRKATWQWLKANWDWIIGHYSGSPLFNDFLRKFADKITNDAEATEIIGFIESKKLKELDLVTMQMKDIAQTNIEWLKRDSKSLNKLIKSQQS